LVPGGRLFATSEISSNDAPHRACLPRYTVGARDVAESYSLTQRQVQGGFLKNEENSRKLFPKGFCCGFLGSSLLRVRSGFAVTHLVKVRPG
jgi:hypothetical protein